MAMMNPVSRNSRCRGIMLAMAAVAYVVLLVIAALSDRIALAVLAFLVLLGAVLWPALMRVSSAAWLLWGVCTLFLCGALYLGIAGSVLELLPVLINTAMAWLFARTLLPGREALITRIVCLVEGADRLDQLGVRDYTRQLTWVWAVVLAVQALLLLSIWCLLHLSVLLQLGTTVYSGLHVWLRFGNYAVIGLLFVLEHGWRRLRLRNVDHLGFCEAVTRIVRCWPELIQGKRA